MSLKEIHICQGDGRQRSMKMLHYVNVLKLNWDRLPFNLGRQIVIKHIKKYLNIYLVQQSSRAFKANRTISTKTGRTTHSFDGFGWVWVILGVLGGVEFGVIIWTLFCLLALEFVLEWILPEHSVCLFHSLLEPSACRCMILSCWLVVVDSLLH